MGKRGKKLMKKTQMKRKRRLQERHKSTRETSLGVDCEEEESRADLSDMREDAAIRESTDDDDDASFLAFLDAICRDRPPYSRTKLPPHEHRARDCTGLAARLNQNIPAATASVSARTLHIMDRLRYKFSAAYRHTHFWQAVARCGRRLRAVKDDGEEVHGVLQRLADASDMRGIELLDDDWLYMPSQPWLVYAGARVCRYAIRLCRLHRVCIVAGRACYAQLAHEQLIVLNLVLISTIARLCSEICNAIESVCEFYDQSMAKWLCSRDSRFPLSTRQMKQVAAIARDRHATSAHGNHGTETRDSTSSHLAFISRLLQLCDSSLAGAESNPAFVNQTLAAFSHGKHRPATDDASIAAASAQQVPIVDLGVAIATRVKRVVKKANSGGKNIAKKNNPRRVANCDAGTAESDTASSMVAQLTTVRHVKLALSETVRRKKSAVSRAILKLLQQWKNSTNARVSRQAKRIRVILRAVRNDVSIVGKKAKNARIVADVREACLNFDLRE